MLKCVWTLLNVALLAAGAITIACSIIWRSPDLVRNFIVSELDLYAGLVLGAAFLLTWIISVGGILQRDHVTVGLVITNWALIFDAIAIVVVGCIMWFYTLTPTANYLKVWQAASPATRQALQDTLSCCGYRQSTELGVNAGFCADTVFAVTQSGCASKILPLADSTLNHVFTSIFGFMVIVLGFFLATVCLVYRRKQRERFRRIDEKRGGQGFV